MDRMALHYADYLTARYGVNFGSGSLWRPHGTIKGETGIHEEGVAIDAPVDPGSALGRSIISDARSNNFYVYTAPHGTGPHIHIETNRNADGTPKGRSRR